MPQDYPEGSEADVGGATYVRRGGQWVRQGATAPQGAPGFVPGTRPPPDPFKAREDARAERASTRDEERLRLDREKREAEAVEATTKREGAETARRSQGRMVLDTVGRAEEQIGDTSRIGVGSVGLPWFNGQTGWLGAIASAFPGTEAYDLRRTIDTLKANLSFDKLAEMRASSPTGGALGSITERELELLGSTVASLDQGQTEEELRRSLALVKRLYAKMATPPAERSSPPRLNPKPAVDAAQANAAMFEDMARRTPRMSGPVAPRRPAPRTKPKPKGDFRVISVED